VIRAAIVGLGRWGQNLVDCTQGKTDKLRFTVGVARAPEKALIRVPRLASVWSERSAAFARAGDAGDPVRRARVCTHQSQEATP